jgi:hypothetical protein
MVETTTELVETTEKETVEETEEETSEEETTEAETSKEAEPETEAAEETTVEEPTTAVETTAAPQTTAAPETTAAQPVVEVRDGSVSYTIQSGDTVKGVCERMGIDFKQNLSRIEALNPGLDIDHLSVGQVIYLPR